MPKWIKQLWNEGPTGTPLLVLLTTGMLVWSIGICILLATIIGWLVAHVEITIK